MNETAIGSNLAISRSYPYGMVSILMDGDCQLTVQVNDITVPVHSLFAGATGYISCVSVLVQLLKKLEGVKPCVGNPDGKFDDIRNSRNGKFKNQTGELLVVYYVLYTFIEILKCHLFPRIVDNNYIFYTI